MSASRPTRCEIDLDALAFNFHSSKQFMDGVNVMAVVKANAYGHGAVEVARTLERAGVERLAVATVSEAR